MDRSIAINCYRRRLDCGDALRFRGRFQYGLLQLGHTLGPAGGVQLRGSHVCLHLVHRNARKYTYSNWPPPAANVDYTTSIYLWGIYLMSDVGNLRQL